MFAHLFELLNLWGNPVFHRFRRSRLRIRKCVAWYLLTLIVTTFALTLPYILRTNSGISEQSAARSLWIPLLIIQGLILLFKGTGSVSAGLIQDKIDQTLDYQRLTPLSPIRNLLGYLFGLPLMEYAMLALTLPHLAFVVFVGHIPLDIVFSVYLVFFTCAILYHVTAIAVGMVMQKWIWGYLLSIVTVAFLNIVLPTFISQFGLKFFQHLSIWPVIGQKVLPLVLTANDLLRAESQLPFFSMGSAVPFFNWSLSPFAFTLILQAALIVTFAIMALRRWQAAAKHSLSKPYALAILAGFIVLVTGNLWPAITGQFMPFALFGQTDIEELSEVVAIGLPLMYSLTVWLLCVFLFSIVVPNHNAFVRGIRRAIKLDKGAARPWHDDAASIPFMSLFTLIALLGFWVLYREILAAGFLDFLAETDFRHWRLPLALGLVLTYTFLLLQVLQKLTVLVILLLWFLPILVSIVLSAAMQNMAVLQTVIASISPLALIVMSGLLPLQTIVPPAVNEFGFILTGVNTGFVFIFIQIAWLSYRWRQLKRGFQLACQSGTGGLQIRRQ